MSETNFMAIHQIVAIHRAMLLAWLTVETITVTIPILVIFKAKLLYISDRSITNSLYSHIPLNRRKHYPSSTYIQTYSASSTQYIIFIYNFPYLYWLNHILYLPFQPDFHFPIFLCLSARLMQEAARCYGGWGVRKGTVPFN